MKKVLLFIVLPIVFVLSVLLMGVEYLKYSERMVFQESASHLSEIYSYLGKQISSVHSHYITILHQYRDELAFFSGERRNDEMVKLLVDNWRESDTFEGFYFVSRDGDMMDVDGKFRRFQLYGKLVDLMIDGKDIVADVSLPGAESLTLYGAKCEPLEYMGFTYEAVAMVFRNDTIVEMLDVNAFDGESDNYVVDENGKIILNGSSYRKEDSRFYNLFDHLTSAMDKGKEESRKIIDQIANGKRGVLEVRINGVEQYLVYSKLDISSWILVGMIESAVVNRNINSFQKATVILCVAIGMTMLLVFYLIFFYMYKRGKERQNEEIRFRDGLFDNLSRNVNQVFIIMDSGKDSVVYVTPNVYSVLGVEEEKIYSDISSLDNVGSSISIRSRLKDHSSSKEGFSWTQDYINGVDGSKKYLEATVYHTMFGSLERDVLVIADRSEDRMLRDALSASLEVAKNANNAKSNFLANMSHDIRTPMNAIVGYSTLLSHEAYSPEKVIEISKKIAFSSNHLLSLINDVLDMSKIESGKTSLNIEKVELSSVLQNIYEIVSVQVKAKGQSFKVRTQGILPDYFLADSLRLNQILLNLLSNAVKYTKSGGNISLTVEGRKGRGQNAHIRFIVADDGQGMSPEFIDTIFDPFSRERNAENSGVQGTGLGMSITKSLIDLMGGTIKVESEQNSGSVFTVDLDFAKVEDEDSRSFFLEHGITRLLIVDDEKSVCSTISRIVGEVGIQAESAYGGYEAVVRTVDAVKRGEPYDVVVVDLRMPDMDGVETVKRVRKEVGPNVPIFILSSYDMTDIEESAASAGVDILLPKPFFLSTFQHALDGYFNRNKAREVKDCDSFSGIKILIAEDNEINAEIIVELLNRIGVESTVTYDGKEVVEKFISSGPDEFDMVFMDIQMPVMDGYEAAKAIRRSSSPHALSIPIIAMTANAFEDDKRASMEAGMNAHISKPIDFESLKETILCYRRKRDC